MNREIKFRAWDIERKEMYVDNVDLDEISTDSLFSNYYGFYNIMQYIGLKDKNGKEIYQGDIIKLSSHSIDNPKKIYKEVELTSKFMESRTFDGKITTFWVGNQPLESIWGDIEIVGNIYENPELM